MTRAVAAIAIVFATAARAQPPMPFPEYEDLRLGHRRGGIGLALGAGVSGFTGDVLRRSTATGGQWTARLTLATRAPASLELAYIGSAQAIDALGLDDDAVLVSNGAQGVLRVNARAGFALEPFAFIGLGWRRYQLAGTDSNTSDVAAADDVFEFPMGLGLTGYFGDVILDLRGEYRRATEEDMMPALGDRGGAAMHGWGVTLSVGYSVE